MAIPAQAPVAPGAAPPCGDADSPGPCVDRNPVAEAVPVERNRFFTGKYMTARDFRDEQSYFLGRDRLHQRAMHGWGIVVGLEVCPHPDKICAAKGWFVITPGIAFDPLGRPLVLKEMTPIRLDALFPQTVECGCESRYGTKNEEIGGYLPDNGPQPGADFLIGLCYGEQNVEPVPVLYDDGCGQRTASNRILERPCPRYRPLDPHDACWGPVTPPSPVYPPLPATDACQCLAGASDCSMPDEPCGPNGFIPLAHFRYQRQPDGLIQVVVNDQSRRRYIFGPLHPYTLTHIKNVNWHHGQNTHVRELVTWYRQGREEAEKAGYVRGYVRHGDRAHLYLRLEFEFDGPLCQDDHILPHVEPVDNGETLAFYRRILRVRYENEKGGLSPLFPPGIAHLNECRTKLYYDIPWKCLRELKDHVYSPIIHVSLNCDFLPDRKGRAVDGDHLRGSLAIKDNGRSGDGVEGGLFESWFRLEWDRNEANDG